jgi:hypothetical protein
MAADRASHHARAPAYGHSPALAARRWRILVDLELDSRILPSLGERECLQAQPGDGGHAVLGHLCRAEPAELQEPRGGAREVRRPDVRSGLPLEEGAHREQRQPRFGQRAGLHGQSQPVALD